MDEEMRDEQLRRRFRLDPATPEERVAGEDPETAVLAMRIMDLSTRFGLGVTWPEAIEKARGERHVSG